MWGFLCIPGTRGELQSLTMQFCRGLMSKSDRRHSPLVAALGSLEAKCPHREVPPSLPGLEL